MTKSANEIAQEYARRAEREAEGLPNGATTVRRLGRVIGVFDVSETDLVHGHVPGEDLITERGSVTPYGEHYLIVDDEDMTRRYFVNLQRYRFVEFWVRDDDDEDDEGE